jgi:UDP-GlcNAc:undecaprenyl-phosphate GlcNAc-1-phosphate transferase
MRITAAQFAILGIAAFALTGLLTWPVRALAIRLGVMDKPNTARKTQAEPVPYLGGVAIALGVSTVTFGALFFTNNPDVIIERGLVAIIPAIILGLVGLIDDLKSLTPWTRLLIQTIVGSAIAFIIVQNGTFGTPFESSFLNTFISIVWIVGICNSINFFDNLDGAASGTVAIAALGVFYIAFDRGQELVSALSIVTAGATLGFLMWNKSPAKIYMGDAGALFLGVVISVLSIRLNPGISPAWQSLAIPVMLLAVPLLDTCVAVFSRLGRGMSPLTGGRDHLSHRLVRLGLTRRTAAISLWFTSGVSALCAVGVYHFAGFYRVSIIISLGLLWLLALVLFLRIPSQD